MLELLSSLLREIKVGPEGSGKYEARDWFSAAPKEQVLDQGDTTTSDVCTAFPEACSLTTVSLPCTKRAAKEEGTDVPSEKHF
ncbi:hypothetical protein VZT92_003895 [Zoarces viviparus]|uniref:Uncharacterized protein n=1 Tax=Zoarces viviparus TaxID=48416 RepID=A0AAW1FUV7_ZOAVI